MKLYGFDSETHSFWDGNPAPPVVCVSVMCRVPRLLDRRRGLRWVGIALGDPDVHIVGHNVSYDLGCACARVPELIDSVFVALEAGRIHDTGIREGLLDIARGTLGRDPATGKKLSFGDTDEDGVSYPLSFLWQRYFGEDITAEKKSDLRTSYGTLDGIHTHRWTPEERDYPKRDAQRPLAIFHKQAEAAKTTLNGGNLHDEARSVYNAFVLHLVHLWGLRTNRAAVAKLQERIEQTHAERLKQFMDVKVGIIRGPNSPDKGKEGTENKKRVQEMVFYAYHGDPPRSDKGAIKTDRDTKLESGDPILTAHASSGRNDKYRTTYLHKLWNGTEHPINPRFYGMAATTRVTSDYQQLPQKGGIRECHSARDGTVYCSVDYGGLELRTMAQRALWHPEVRFSKMADALLAKLDVHTVAAASFVNSTYEAMLARVKAKEPIAEGYRALGKVENFGKGGGMSDRTLVYHARAKDNVRFCQLVNRLPLGKCGSQGLETITVRREEKRVCKVCVKVSSELGTKWLDAWLEQKLLFEISRRLHPRESSPSQWPEVEIPFVKVMRGKVSYTQWLNAPFQGLGAVLTMHGMRLVSKEMYTNRRSPLWGSRLVLNVHDELVAELRTTDGWQRVHDAAERIGYLMREPAREILPDLYPAVEAEPALSYVLSKDVKTIRDKNGVLQPWEPKAA